MSIYVNDALLELELQLLITILTIYIEWCLYHGSKQRFNIVLCENKQAENTLTQKLL